VDWACRAYGREKVFIRSFVEIDYFEDLGIEKREIEMDPK
jgi:hypothetical protein